MMGRMGRAMGGETVEGTDDERERERERRICCAPTSLGVPL